MHMAVPFCIELFHPIGHRCWRRGWRGAALAHRRQERVRAETLDHADFPVPAFHHLSACMGSDTGVTLSRSKQHF